MSDQSDRTIAEPTGVEIAVQEFRAKVLRLLESNWPHRSETDDDTAKRAATLAKQLRNWETWK